MNFNKILCVGCLIFGCFAFSQNVLAGLTDEIQVYDGEINQPNESNLELHINTSPNGIGSAKYYRERTTDRSFHITPEYSYGITKTLEFGLYLPTLYTPQYGYELAGYKARLKWLPLQATEIQPWSMGGQYRIWEISHRDGRVKQNA
jgi:hypothetical protein